MKKTGTSLGSVLCSVEDKVHKCFGSSNYSEITDYTFCMGLLTVLQHSDVVLPFLRDDVCSGADQLIREHRAIVVDEAIFFCFSAKFSTVTARDTGCILQESLLYCCLLKSYHRILMHFLPHGFYRRLSSAQD